MSRTVSQLSGFIEVTLEAYRAHVGEEFGKRIPGSFTDEPQLRPAGRLPWTDDLPVVFEFDPASLVLTAFGRVNAGTYRGDAALADRFLNVFFRI